MLPKPKKKKKKKKNALVLISHASHRDRVKSLSTELEKVEGVSDQQIIQVQKTQFEMGKLNPIISNKQIKIKVERQEGYVLLVQSLICIDHDHQLKQQKMRMKTMRIVNEMVLVIVDNNIGNHTGSNNISHHHANGTINFSIKNMGIIECGVCGKSTFFKQVQSWLGMSPSLLTGAISSMHIGGMTGFQFTLAIPQCKINDKNHTIKGVAVLKLQMVIAKEKGKILSSRSRSQSMTRARRNSHTMDKNKKIANTNNNSKNSTKHTDVANMDLANISINNNIHNHHILGNHHRSSQSVSNYHDDINNVSIRNNKNTVAVRYGSLHGGIGYQYRYQNINEAEKRQNIYRHNINNENNNKSDIASQECDDNIQEMVSIENI